MVDDRRALGTFSTSAHQVSATLVFDADGWLRDFISDDRLRTSPESDGFEAMRWSTPLFDYCTVGPYQIATRGVAVWHAPSGTYEYIQVRLLELEIHGNVYRPNST